MRPSTWLGIALGLALAGAPTASATDYWDLASSTDNGMGTENELLPCSSQQHDLEANPLPEADEDWYVVVNYPQSSYEALVDSTSGDLNMFNLPNFERLDSTGAVLQTSEPANVGFAGFSTALRWQHTTAAIEAQFLRVRSAPLGCGISCGPEDQYKIRYHDTTIVIPRFNNAGSQITILLIQNTLGWTRNVSGTVYFRDVAGTLVGSTPFSLAAHAMLVLNTAAVAPGVGGAIAIAHDGGCGSLAAKTVALEPSSGFSFDTPGVYRGCCSCS